MSVPTIFDRALLRARRARAAPYIDQYDFLIRHTAEILADRLSDVRRQFSFALDLGSHHGIFPTICGGRGGVQHWILSDSTPAMLRQPGGLPPSVQAVAAEEEFIPFAPQIFDLVISNLSLQAVNDVPGTLAQIRQCLKPDGLFLAAMTGGETLQELRAILAEAEIAEYGGMSPRVAPAADLRDMAGLLQRAGFTLPVADIETIQLTYQNFFDLCRDLRGMGATNCLMNRHKVTARRGLFARAAALYADRYTNADGLLTVPVQVIFLTGWAPDAQPQSPTER